MRTEVKSKTTFKKSTLIKSQKESVCSIILFNGYCHTDNEVVDQIIE